MKNETEPKPAHGGARAGAGRPPIHGERMVRRTITLPGSLAEQLAALGDGNLSAGIRRIAAQAGL